MKEKGFIGIRSKLFLVVVSVASIVMLVGVLGMFGLKKMSDETSKIIDDELPRLISIQESLNSLLRGMGAFNRILVVDDFSKIGDLRDDEVLFRQSITVFDVFLQALIWGSESEAFAKSSAGITKDQWLRGGYGDRLTVQQPSKAQAQLAAFTSIYFGAFVNYGMDTIRNHKDYLRLVDLNDEIGAEGAKMRALESRKNVNYFLGLTIDQLGQMLKSSDRNMFSVASNIASNQKRILLYFILVVIFGFFGAFIVSSRFTKRVVLLPILDLVDSIKDAGKSGKLKTIAVNTDDEIGILAGEFNKMADQINSANTNLQNKMKLIEEEKNKMANILDSMDDGVCVVDRKGVVTYFNPVAEKITEVKSEDAVGDDYYNVLKFSNTDNYELIVDALGKGKSKTSPSEVSAEISGGKEISYRVVSLRGMGGDINACIVFFNVNVED